MITTTINVLDRERSIHRHIDARYVEYFIAALSLEPETIKELELATARFLEPKGEWGLLDSWSEGLCEIPRAAGIVFIDLPARLIVTGSSKPVPAESGCVPYHNGVGRTRLAVRYHLSRDWSILPDRRNWRSIAEDRRKSWGPPRLDARSVLYGEVAEFVYEQCLAARAGGAKNPIVDIHAKWLLTKRPDLRDRSPRELLLEKRDYIDWDLQDRADQWSAQGRCPPGLSKDTAAYCLGGFGTHEIVVYYDLVRYVLEEAWRRTGESSGRGAAAEIADLRALQEKWLRAPQGDCSEFVPCEVIEQERCRLPLVDTCGDHIDDDCPLCQLMASGSYGPMFVHFDGSHMEDEFAFSFHDTYKEWESDRAAWDDRARLESPQGDGSVEDDAGFPESPWQQSYSNLDLVFRSGERPGPQVLLMGLAAHLAELKCDLRSSSSSEVLNSDLDRDFGNLVDAVRSGSMSLVDPLVDRFCEDLDRLADGRPDLADKCSDLQQKLSGVAECLSPSE